MSCWSPRRVGARLPIQLSSQPLAQTQPSRGSLLPPAGVRTALSGHVWADWKELARWVALTALHLPWGSEKHACGPLLTWRAAPPCTSAALWLSSGKDQPRSWVKLYLGVHPGLPTDCSLET